MEGNEFNPVKALLECAKHAEDTKRREIEREKKLQRRHNWRVSIITAIMTVALTTIIAAAVGKCS